MLSLDGEEGKNGVIAASTGNHGLGVSLAAKMNGMYATIYVPNGTPELKTGGMKANGADVMYKGDECGACEITARKDSIEN